MALKPDNEPQTQTAYRVETDRLGFTHDATLKKRALDSEGVYQDLMVWSLFADNYPASPATNISFQAFDCMGDALYHTRSGRNG
jgi:hypothetical protein